MKNNKHIPVYNLDNFRLQPKREQQYQVEVFNANRHFEVSYPHRHNFYEILFILKGSGYHIIDINRYKITPPLIFFLSPGQAHKLEFSKDIDGYIFLFTSEFYLLNQANKNRLLEFPFFFSLDKKNPPVVLKSGENASFIAQIFNRGCELMKIKNRFTNDIIRSLLELILQTSLSLYPDNLQNTFNGRSYFMVKNFLLLMEENYTKNLRINEYADMLAVTPNHLTQSVKQATGKTTNQLLQERMVAEIKRLLLHTQLNVSEIAENLNFPDQSYFSKFFKKHTGLTPQQYRRH